MIILPTDIFELTGITAESLNVIDVILLRWTKKELEQRLLLLF